MKLQFLCILFICLLCFLVTLPSFISPIIALDSLVKEYPTVIEHIYARFDTIKTSLADYAWPTDASRTITSTFAEYRRAHFHAGIDISTNNRTGYKVFASRDGYVWRISISHTGYGKVLYLKHDDGYTTTYAHLKTFNDTINTIVRREQFRMERYPIDLILDPQTLPVKKGDVIAYTGSSGIGSPHLHFEIRDENFNPINPSAFGGFDNITISDNLPPTIQSLVIIPLDNNSTVSGKRQPLILRNFAGQKGNYRLARKIEASGKIGFGIDARDRIDGTHHRVGIHRLELYINDSLSFSAQLDRLPANESKQIFLFYSLPLLKSGKGRFKQLFVEENTSLPIYERWTSGAGIIDATILSEGEHSFSIVCKDIRGNATKISGTMTLSRPPEKNHYLVASNTLENKTKDEHRNDVFTIPVNTSGWFSSDRDTLQIVYDSGAVFRPLNVQIEKELYNSETIYRLYPQDALLNKGIRIFIRSSHSPNKSKALYVRDNHRFEMRPTSFDSTTGYFSTTLTYTLGDIALLEDTTRPQIDYVKFNLRRKRPIVQFRVNDDLSGIDANEIKTYIDNEFVIPEIDDRWRVRCEVDKPLTRGKHRLAVVVKDNMKNTLLLTRTFVVQ